MAQDRLPTILDLHSLLKLLNTFKCKLGICKQECSIQCCCKRNNKNVLIFDSNIKREGITVLVVLFNEQQTSILRAPDEGLVYPDYTWVQIEMLLQYLINEDTLTPDRLYRSRPHSRMSLRF